MANENENQNKRAGFAIELWRLVQMSTGLFLIYSMVADIAVKTAAIITQTDATREADR